MTVFTGTNSDDVLPLNRSNRGKDQFFPLLGNDVVDGGSGIDRLTLDYSSISADVVGTLEGSNSFAGYIFSYDSLNSLSFTNLEQIQITSGSGNDTFNVSGKALKTAAAITIDAGAGFDQLGLDFSTLSGDTKFVVSGANVNTNRGSYSNFEAYFITGGIDNDTITTGDGEDGISGGDGNDVLRGGAGNDFISGGNGNDKLSGGIGDDTLLGGKGRNLISGGDGNDTIGAQDSASGIDNVDGGGDYDIWIGNYALVSRALKFNWSGTGVGSLSNGTTLKNIEKVLLVTGTGNDKITTSGGLLEVYDSTTTDFDAIKIDYSTSNDAIFGNIGSEIGETVNGFASDVQGTASARFSQFEKVTILSGSGDDTFNVASTSGISNLKNVLINAGSGSDTLDINFRLSVEDISFVTLNSSSVTNLGTYTNFETFVIRTGNGSDTVTTADGDDIIDVSDGQNVVNSGAGNDNIYSIGIDTIDGGDGTDYWYGGYYESNSSLTLVWDGSGNGTLSNGTTLHNIENVELRSGTGNDTVYLSGGNAQLLDITTGDADTLDADYASRTSNLIVSSSGSTASFTGTIQTEDGSESSYFSNYENVFIKTGTGNDDFTMYSNDQSDPAIAKFDAGLGNDLLKLNTTNKTSGVVFEASGLIVTSNVGQFMNFEAFTIVCGDASDTIKTGAGDDGISGGHGDDFLNGGKGNDSMGGGEGADTFRFSDLHFGTDSISDFVPDVDKLSFSSDVATLFSEFVITGNGTNQVIVTHGTDSITLQVNSPITLQETDFLFV